MLGALSESSIAMRLVGLVRRVTRGLFRHHAFDHAATMAFYFFLGTVPLMVLGGVLLGSFLQTAGAQSVVVPLYRALPGVARELVRTELKDIAEVRAGSMAPLSLLGFLWLTSNGFHNLMDVFELLIGASPRSWWRQRCIAVLWVAATLSAALISILMLVVIFGWSQGLTGPAQVPELLGRVQLWHAVVVGAVFLAVTTVGVATFYRIAVVHPPGVQRRVWPGALASMALWAAISWLFSAYVRVIGHYAIFYGSLATVAVTLLWFYLSSLAFVIGAELNAQLEGVRDLKPSPAL